MFDLLAKTGAALIGVAIILMWASRWVGYRSPREQRTEPRLLWASFFVLLFVGALDLFLYLTCGGPGTVTTWIQTNLPNHWLACIGFMLFVVAHTWLIFGIRGMVPVLVGVVVGHLFG
jgi:hypothetical protein